MRAAACFSSGVALLFHFLERRFERFGIVEVDESAGESEVDPGFGVGVVLDVGFVEASCEFPEAVELGVERFTFDVVARRSSESTHLRRSAL